MKLLRADIDRNYTAITKDLRALQQSLTTLTVRLSLPFCTSSRHDSLKANEASKPNIDNKVIQAAVAELTASLLAPLLPAEAETETAKRKGKKEKKAQTQPPGVLSILTEETRKIYTCVTEETRKIYTCVQNVQKVRCFFHSCQFPDRLTACKVVDDYVAPKVAGGREVRR